MTPEAESGQSLAQRGESLPDANVPERAGAIVAEVITSIAEEAQARAEAARDSAEEQAREQREAARQGVEAVRARLQTIAEHIGSLRSGLREEEERLTAGLRAIDAGEPLPALSPSRSTEAAAEPPRPEAQAPEARTPEPDAPAPAAEEQGTHEGIEDVEVVEETTASDLRPTASESGVETTLLRPAASEDSRARLVSMSDRELAVTYLDALTAARERRLAGLDPGRADDVAAAVVEEARTRPAFADPDTGSGGGRGIGRLVRRRAATAFEELRAAAQRTGEAGHDR